MTAPDTSQTRCFDLSLEKLVLSIATCPLLFALGIWMIIADWSDARRGELAPFAGYLAIMLSIAVLVRGVQLLFVDRRNVLTISPLGLTDIRASPEQLDWHDISGMRIVTYKFQGFLVFKIKPERDITWRRGWFARLEQVVGLAFGRGNVIYMNCRGLKASSSDVRQLILAYWQAHRNN